MNKFTIKQWRQLHNHTQQSLADVIGVSKITVWNWENAIHNPHPKQLEKIAELFNIEVEQIVP